LGRGACERALKPHPLRKGLSGKAKAKTGIGKSEFPGLQGGLRNRGHGGNVNPTRNRKSGLGNPPPTAGAPELYPDPAYPDPPDEEKYLTILTCAGMKTPNDVLYAYDRFDDRSVIENSGNKEAKQAWKLEATLEKSEAAVYLHTFMVFILMALMATFRAQEEADNKALARGKDNGMERYRREVERANRDKVVVRDGECYAVLWAWELAVLGGMQLRWHDTESVETILACYGVVSTQGKSGGPSP